MVDSTGLLLELGTMQRLPSAGVRADLRAAPDVSNGYTGCSVVAETF
jgi:hypothetical protein